MTRGAVKYDARNWMKASGDAELERFRQSAMRHFIQWYRGDTDEDHGAAVFFNINGAEYVKGESKNKQKDKPLNMLCVECGEAASVKVEGAGMWLCTSCYLSTL